MNKIKIKAKEPEFIPSPAHNGEWYDLCVSQDYTLKANDFEYLDLGVCIELPMGYEATLIPRSSTFKKFGILQTNSVGLIDNAFCGDNDWWKFPALAIRDTFIPKGTRIAQFRVNKIQEEFIITVTDHLDNPDRKGLGSTGN